MATQVGKQKYNKGKYVKTDDTDQTVGVNNSLVRSANVNSNENSTVSAASLTKSGSSDAFKFNPAMEQRIKAAKDRQIMRRLAKVKKLVGGDDVKSQFTPGAEEGSKLYEKNLKLQNKLNKKFPQPVSTGGSTVTNSNINNTPASTISNIASSIKPQATINKPSAQAEVIDAYGDANALKKIKNIDPNINDETANKILEASRGIEDESMEDIVASWKRTRKYQ